VLLAVTHSDVCVVVDDTSRKAVLTSMSAIYGRQETISRISVSTETFILTFFSFLSTDRFSAVNKTQNYDY
jgi:hypothetical protein